MHIRAILNYYLQSYSKEVVMRSVERLPGIVIGGVNVNN